ncbi:MAG: hypothetical protein ABWY26_13500 [Microbacterium sp.]
MAVVLCRITTWDDSQSGEHPQAARHRLAGAFTIPAALSVLPPPQSRDERIALLVSEHDCNSGQPATGRIELIELIETATTVELVIGGQPGTGGTCQSNPPTPFTVELEQPLADRTILNAAVAPAREVTLP